MVKIALTGKVRSGKNTVADYLTTKYGMVQFAFGDDLKRKFHEEYPHIPENPKPVRGYQLYGQLKRYVENEDIWINRCFDKIRYVAQVAENYNVTGSEVKFMPVITDLRQPDELSRCQSEDYLIIRVNCPDEIRLDRLNEEGDKFTMEDLNFETEKHVDTFEVDVDLINEGSYEELYKKVDNLMKELGVEPVK